MARAVLADRFDIPEAVARIETLITDKFENYGADRVMRDAAERDLITRDIRFFSVGFRSRSERYWQINC